MTAKNLPIVKLGWLIEQKSTLQIAIKSAIKSKQFARAQFKRAKLVIINQQWRVIAPRIDAHNEQYFDQHN